MSESESASTAGQAQLTDLSYEGHTIPEPDSDRITESLETSGDLYSCEQGDTLWIKGDEYIVVQTDFGFFHNPVVVVGPDGTQGKLIGGTINRESDVAGVAWASDLSEKDEEDVSRGDLIAKFEHVYKLETDRLDRVHKWVPDVNQRDPCPFCEDNGGEPVRIERQASKAVEIRKCANTDCKKVYRFVREFPEPDTATILTRDGGSPEVIEETVSGVFKCEEQDDFKFPIETHSGRDDGFYTASEVADFVNPKMEGDEKFGTVTVKDDDRFGLIVRWRDAPGYSADMTVTFRRISDDQPDYGRYLYSLPSYTFGELMSDGVTRFEDLEWYDSE